MFNLNYEIVRKFLKVALRIFQILTVDGRKDVPLNTKGSDEHNIRGVTNTTYGFTHVNLIGHLKT